MSCINEECKTCKRWISGGSHFPDISSVRSVRALQEASKGVIIPTLKSLIVKEPLDMALYKVLTNEYFPNLEHVDIFRANLNQFAVHPNVKSVILRCCQFEIKEPFADNEFPFPNMESLILNSLISEITPKRRLPKLPQLKHLEIRNCAIDDKLSRNKFPLLRSMVLEGVSVCSKIKITRLKKLHRLELVNVEFLPRKTNWDMVRVVSVTRVRAHLLYKLVNIEIFPNLGSLYIDTAEDLDLKILQPHPTLKKLCIRTSGKIPCLSDLKDRFPLLMELCLDGEVDEFDIPSLHALKKVEVIPIPSIKHRRNWMKKCKKLELFNGREVKLDQRWFNSIK